MAGGTDRYAIEPRGEYVFGHISAGAMRSRRGRERRLVGPGSLVAWDPSAPHSGVAVEGGLWFSRLIVVEAQGLEELAGGDSSQMGEPVFPEPIVSDPELIAGFRRMHAALDGPGTRLETDELLATWLRLVIERRSASRHRGRPRLGERDDRALTLARDYIGEHFDRNISLEQLASVAQIGKFRLIRLFRERTGLPPHAFLVAHRIRAARRLLEQGETAAQAAAATGFADQSHLHRHFSRTLGITPGAYRDRFQAEARRRGRPTRSSVTTVSSAWSSPHANDMEEARCPITTSK
jgi:AraC-like DNA-binding protein